MTTRKHNGAALDARVAAKTYGYVIELTRVDFDTLENQVDSAIVETKKVFIGSGVDSPESKLDEYLKTVNVKPYFGWDDRCYPQFAQKRVYGEKICQQP